MDALVAVGAVAGDEALEVFSSNEPARLATDLKSAQLTGPEITAHRLNAQPQSCCNLWHGQKLLVGHRRHVTKHTTMLAFAAHSVTTCCVESSTIEDGSRRNTDRRALNDSQAHGVSATIDTERQAMFSKPKTTSFVAAAEPIDVNEKYLVKLSEIKDEGISKFADPADADPPHNLRWVFRLAHLDRTPILNIDGMPYEHHDYTSNRTGKSKTKTAKARLWAEALMGRSIEDEEIDDALPNTLREKVAVCLFEEVERGGQDGQEMYMRLRILRLSPHRTAAAQRTPVAAAAPSPMPQPAPQPVAAASAGDLPWN